MGKAPAYYGGMQSTKIEERGKTNIQKVDLSQLSKLQNRTIVKVFGSPFLRPHDLPKLPKIYSIFSQECLHIFAVRMF
jgi:hypothetical protein